MPFLPNKSRLVLSILIVLSFFIPARDHVSAFSFISLALSEAKSRTDITLIDALLIIAPLVLIPVIAIAIFVRSAMEVSIRKTILGLPLLLLAFFFLVLSFAGHSSSVQKSVSRLFFDMQIGFYLAAIACLLLLFTKNASRRRHKRRKRSSVKEVEVTILDDI